MISKASHHPCSFFTLQKLARLQNTELLLSPAHHHPKSSSWLQNLNQLDQTHINFATYASLLRWCGHVKALSIGKQVHNHIVRNTLEQNTFLGNLVLQMYCDCGALYDAWGLFGSIHKRNVFSWNIIIAALVQHGQSEFALQLLDQMRSEGVVPDKHTFITIISACTTRVDDAEGKWVHSFMLSCAMELDVLVGNLLISMYSKCGSIEDAQRTFDSMPVRDVVSWNTMIAAYAFCKLGNEALQLFKQTQQERVVPDKFTFIGTLSACASQEAISEGKHIHNLILGRKLESDVAVGNALIHMYGKCGTVQNARTTFDYMHEKNTISWTAMIAVYTQHEQGQESLQLFKQMQQEAVIPSKVTFVTILDACASQKALTAGRQMHAHIVGSNIKSDIFLETALVNMYGKCGSIESARATFDNMSQRNMVSWSAMIAVYAQHAQAKEALQLLEQMQQEGEVLDKIACISILNACASQAALKEGEQIHTIILACGFQSNVVVGTALINMYAKCGCLEDAWGIFNKMCERNAVSWNAMIAAYTQHGKGKFSLQLFEQMLQEGLAPDEITLVNIFSACASETDLASGKRMHTLVLSSGFHSDILLWNAIVNMYGKCGNLEGAQRVFDRMPERNAVSWNAMIAAFAQNGYGYKSLNLLNQMKQEAIQPDKATFAAILSACGHAGLIDEAFHCFGSMTQDHGITPMVDHYNCMIDILGRAGRLDEADDLLKRMPCKPTVFSLMTLLGACRSKADVKRGENTAIDIFKTDPGIAAPYILLSNMYAAAGRSDDVLKLHQMRKSAVNESG